MRIVFRDMKEGVLKIKIETPEDVWHLSKIIEAGNLVRGRTKRKTSIKRGREVIEGDARPVTLTIEVEKVAFQQDMGKLRLLGKIMEGPDDIQMASYHTLQVEPGQAVTVTKAWKKHELERLESAAKPSPRVFICMIDRDGAKFYRLLPSGPESAGEIKFQRSGRPGEEENRDGYYNKILETLREREEAIMIAGPGFERENLYKFIKSKGPETAKRAILEHAHDTEITGVTEVLKKSADAVLARHRVSQETGWVETFLEEIRKDGLAVYGPEETEEALHVGAASTLMVSEEKISVYEKLLEQAEKTGAEIRIISSTHEAGEVFLGMGGVGGLLRYKLPKPGR
jgi:protein pelota